MRRDLKPAITRPYSLEYQPYTCTRSGIPLRAQEFYVD